MKSDNQIAQEATIRPIQKIADKLDVSAEYLLPYGHDKAKISLDILTQKSSKKGNLVLVTAISPTPAGEGKTTTSIGLGQGFSALGESVCVALREPSLGPCMGVKGGATGGGYSQVIPADSINLHFTGDFHAISTAHNLLSAVIDNHMHHGNALALNPKRIAWPRVMDMNDRSLRKVVVGMGPRNGVMRESSFDITVASEIMAILCLATDIDDLRSRLDQIIIGYNTQHKPVRAKEFNVTGAIVALLKDALQPNLVQALEGTPVLIHGGPFANIAHGCNSVLATKMSMHLADWTVTEAGFGCDLGAEKFLDIKCIEADLHPCAVVIVTTIRALKMHGGQGKQDLQTENLKALEKGLENLTKHIETIQAFDKPLVVAINHFHTDSEAELEMVAKHCETLGVPYSHARHFAEGGQGAKDLAQKVINIAKNAPHKALYEREWDLKRKIETVAKTVYGADGIKLSDKAQMDLRRLHRQGFSALPICIAKTQNSLSDNPKLLGRPRGFHITVQRLLINAGAGFVVVLTGDIMRMPGLPKRPAAENIDVVDGNIVGIS